MIVENKLFFKLFLFLIFILCVLGLFFGILFSVNAVFFAVCMLVLQLINLSAFMKKLSNYKMVFKKAEPKRSQIMIDKIEEITPKKQMFFAAYKVIVYLFMALWFWFCSNAKLLSISGVLTGVSLCMLCVVLQNIIKMRFKDIA